MTGTRAGGRKAAKTLKARYGKNYFHINGAKVATQFFKGGYC